MKLNSYPEGVCPLIIDTLDKKNRFLPHVQIKLQLVKSVIWCLHQSGTPISIPYFTPPGIQINETT